MNMLDKGLWSGNKFSSQLWGAQRWTLLVLLLNGLWAGAAQADVSITSITQNPQNTVNVGTQITYQVNYTSTGGSNEQVRTIIIDNDIEVTGNFQVTSSNCFIETYIYCSPVTTTDTFTISRSSLTEGTHNLNFSIDCASIYNPDCIGNSQSITTVVGNSDLPSQQPIANAGPDQSITDTNNDGFETVILDASNSSDLNNDIVSYEWYDSSETLIATGVSPTVNLSAGSHTLTLIVTDSMQNTSSDSVDILVQIVYMEAYAGPDQTVIDSDNNGIESITLDASGSTIPYGVVAEYRWTDGTEVISRDANPTVDLAVGTHLITLRIYDGEATSDSTITITVQKPEPSNNEPGIEILAGANQRLSEGDYSDPFSIRATGPDGLPLEGATVTWTVIPADAATLTSDTTTTDSNGVSSNIVRLTAERIPGSFHVSATIPSGRSARFTVNPLAGISGLTPAQRSIAGALDNACPALQALNNEIWTTQEQSLLDTCDYLATASDPEIISALNQFIPDEIAAQGKNSINFARIRNRNILLRLNALRRGYSGPSLDNLTVSIQGEQLPSFLISELSGLPSGAGASADESSLASPLGIFVNGNISFGDTETTAREAGFDFSTNGLTLGIDYRYTNEFVLGGAFNYLSTDSDYTGKSSNLDIDGYSLSLYGSYYKSEQIFVDSIVSIGLNSYDSKREFTTGGMDHSLKGDTDGTEYELSIGAGYEYNNQNFSFVPEARINYLHIEVDSYDETSANSGLNLSIDQQDIESLVASVSGSFSMAYSTVYGVFIPYLTIEWEHEFSNDSRAIVARFVNDPSHTDFSVLTDNPDRDYFHLGLGVTAALQKGKSAFLYYEDMLGHNDTSQYSITGGFRLEF